MFYYEKYNSTVMLTSFLVYALLIFLLLRKRVTSLIDPLLNNIIWSASSLALLTSYAFSMGINSDNFVFVFIYVLYIGGLYIFLERPSHSQSSLEKELNNKSNTTLFIFCTFLNLGSRIEFFQYAISNPSVASWFLYKFTQWEGRSFVQYILQIGARPFFIYYLFVLLKTNPQWRGRLIFILAVNSFLDIVAGGRSSLLGLIEAYGYFVFYFNTQYNKKAISKLNIYGGTLIGLSIFASVLVTSFYSADGTIEDAAMNVANRILSAGDGLEMYLSNDASSYIESGVTEYIKATFGIFVKQIIPIETQSIGWKLYELDTGRVSAISVGPNFILPLQAMVFGKYFLVIYTIFISFCVSFLRGNSIKSKLITIHPLSFVLGVLTFQLVIDAEFFVLQVSACVFIYFVFLYPVKKIKFIRK